MNTMPLPAGPFFCAQDGRYLPGLTPGPQIADRSWEIVEALAEVEIEFAAMEQRLQIEQELLKIRLKQKCFAALAAQCPQSVVLSPQPEDEAPRQQRPTSCSIKVFPLGPVSTKGTDGALRQQCPTGFGVYPKGRW